MLPTDRGHYMYVLRCADDSLYAGYTVDLPRRLACHGLGKASKYTRTRRPVAVAAWWAFLTQRDAMQAEWGFKQLTRGQKLLRIAASPAQHTLDCPLAPAAAVVGFDNES